jgi:hypothetical protein
MNKVKKHLKPKNITIGLGLILIVYGIYTKKYSLIANGLSLMGIAP